MTTDEADESWDGRLKQLNDLGLAYEQALSALDRELAENPHRDKVAARNALTLRYCCASVRSVAGYLVGDDSPAGPLWQRLTNALSDRIAGTEPALFFEIEQQNNLRGNASGITVGSAALAFPALALDDLMEGGFTEKDALAWLDRAFLKLQIKDTGGDLLTGQRVADLRNNFRLGRGSKNGRVAYNKAKKRAKADLPIATRREAEELAHETLMALKIGFDHDLPKAPKNRK